MAELLLPKQITRVRFPSSALDADLGPGHRALTSRAWSVTEVDPTHL